MTITTAARSRAGFIGAMVQHARHDARATTAAARVAALARFDREVDPTNSLTPAERSRRAEFARKAYFARLALKSARVRRRNGTAALGGGRPEDKEVRRVADAESPNRV